MKYADKRRSQAICAAPECSFVGVMLRLVNARPDWFCAEHADALDSRTKEKP